MPHEFTFTRRVEFADTDTAGVAHFTAFFRYMEEAEHAFYRSLGSSAYRVEADRVEGMPRVSASCDFFRPVRYADVLEVRLIVRERTAKAVRYEVVFRRREEESADPRGAGAADSGIVGDDSGVVARGEMTVLHVARPHGSLDWVPVDLPPELREGLEVAPGSGMDPGPGEGLDPGTPAGDTRRLG